MGTLRDGRGQDRIQQTLDLGHMLRCGKTAQGRRGGVAGAGDRSVDGIGAAPPRRPFAKANVMKGWDGLSAAIRSDGPRTVHR